MSYLAWACSAEGKGAERGLRRGAWYPVLETSDRFVVLDVNDIQVRFTRERLRFRAAPPSGWTVVQLSPEEATAEARAHGHPDTEVVRVYLVRSEEHTSELQSPCNLVCRLLLEKKKR